jgi:hypothetical protein
MKRRMDMEEDNKEINGDTETGKGVETRCREIGVFV